MLSLALLAASVPVAGGPQRVVVDRDDLVVVADCVLVAGPEPVADRDGDGVVQVVAEGVTVGFEGPPLRGAAPRTPPDELDGAGIVVRAPGVTLRGVRVAGYRAGIRAFDADGLVVEEADVSDNFRQRLGSTVEREDPGDWLWPHENDRNEWLQHYGAGIWIEESRDVTVRRCRARRGQNGLVLDGVTDSRVVDNDFSFLSGWGIALWRSSGNLISRNACDFCVRGYSQGVYNRGQDSAGILLFEQCTGNAVLENSATHCGDGFFAFSGREALGEAGLPFVLEAYVGRGNRGNRIAGNDFSYAVAHGLELTFGFDNVVEGNRLVGNGICGLWGGYSRGTLVRGNELAENGELAYGLERGGVNVEHGRGNRIEGNRFRANACGVRLWDDADVRLARLPWVRANGGASGDNLVLGNTFEGDRIALELLDAGPTTVAGNRYEGVGEERAVEGDSPVRSGPVPELAEGALPALPAALGESRPVGARAGLGGREAIVIGAWGPYDGTTPLLRRLPGSDAVHRYALLGAKLARHELAGDAVAEETEDGVLVLRAAEPPAGEEDGIGRVVPYELAVHTAGGERLDASGVLAALVWDVRAFAWTRDPREDEAAWRAAVEGATARTALEELRLRFGAGGPAKLAGPRAPGFETLPADRFGIAASARVRLPSGSWVLRTVSDDGIRVSVDGERVVDDWTHHAARVHDAALELAQPRVVTLAVEHFELDGAAELSVTFEHP